MTTPEPPTPQPVSVPSNLADWGTRAIGFLIDYLPIFLIGLLTAWSGFLRYFSGLIAIAYWAYMGYLDGIRGQTPGKMIQGIRVVNQEGYLVGAGLGVGRKFLHILDSLVCFLGWFLPIVDDKRQTIADKVAVTYVVTGAQKSSFSLDLWMPPQQATTTPQQGTPPPELPPEATPPQSTPPEATPPEGTPPEGSPPPQDG